MRYRIGRAIYMNREDAIRAATDTVVSCVGTVTIHIDRIQATSQLVPMLERALAGQSVDGEIQAYLKTREAWSKTDEEIDVMMDKSGVVVIRETDIPF